MQMIDIPAIRTHANKAVEETSNSSLAPDHAMKLGRISIELRRVEQELLDVPRPHAMRSFEPAVKEVSEKELKGRPIVNTVAYEQLNSMKASMQFSLITQQYDE